jgi:hypothetical protein
MARLTRGIFSPTCKLNALPFYDESAKLVFAGAHIYDGKKVGEIYHYIVPIVLECYQRCNDRGAADCGNRRS